MDYLNFSTAVYSIERDEFAKKITPGWGGEVQVSYVRARRCKLFPLPFDGCQQLRFKMMIYPEMVNEGKGGCCFRRAISAFQRLWSVSGEKKKPPKTDPKKTDFWCGVLVR